MSNGSAHGHQSPHFSNHERQRSHTSNHERQSSLMSLHERQSSASSMHSQRSNKRIGMSPLANGLHVTSPYSAPVTHSRSSSRSSAINGDVINLPSNEEYV